MSASKFSVSFVKLVLIFGLVSGCGPKGSDSITDSFKLDPELVSSTDGTRISSIGRTPIDGVVDSNDWLGFPSIKDHNFGREPVTFQVRSICQTGEQIEKSTKTFANIDLLKIRALMPAATVANPADENRNPVCSFEFTARNFRGSEHRFRLAQMQIKAPVEGAGLGLQGDPQENALLQVTSQAGGDFSVPGIVSLICEKTKAQRTSGNVLSEDLRGLVETARRKSGREYLEQKCRYVAESGAATAATSYFKLRFGDPGVDISSAATLDYDYRSQDYNLPITLFRSTVTNHDNIDRWVFVPNGPPRSLRFRVLALSPVYQPGPIQVLAGQPVQKSAVWAIPASLEAIPVPNGRVFKLRAGKAADLTISENRDSMCLQALAAGMKVGFAQDVSPRALLQPYVAGQQLSLGPAQLPFSAAEADYPFMTFLQDPSDPPTLEAKPMQTFFPIPIRGPIDLPECYARDPISKMTVPTNRAR